MDRRLTMLDLFSGLRGASRPWADRGHLVRTVDRDARFRPDVCADIASLQAEDLAPLGPFDFIWASPPCEKFSVMAISRNWTPDGQPRLETQLDLELVRHTLGLIEDLTPTAWVLENPVGMLRKQDVVAALERRTVTYCQYGLPYRKPTDLWGGFPATLALRPPCAQRADCHRRSPRGSRTGLQGVHGRAHRAMVPWALALDVCQAMEAQGSA